MPCDRSNAGSAPRVPESSRGLRPHASGGGCSSVSEDPRVTLPPPAATATCQRMNPGCAEKGGSAARGCRGGSSSSGSNSPGPSGSPGGGGSPQERGSAVRSTELRNHLEGGEQSTLGLAPSTQQSSAAPPPPHLKARERKAL